MILGLGVDTIEIERIARIFGMYGDRFLNRIFAAEEQAYARRFKDPAPRLAARFAAKEACMKALGTGWNDGVRWCDIVVINSPMGKPELQLRGRAKWYMDKLAATHTHLSITHDRGYATVIVILE
jgi:holo-[acyl-carrier protein] synthase